MQPWKVKQMSYKRIHAWIIVINKLLAYYEGRLKKLQGCPLCDLPGTCETGCLWGIFEGKTCCDFKEEMFPNTYIGWGLIDWDRLKRSKRWRSLRIPMLRNWKKILKAELARRET